MSLHGFNVGNIIGTVLTVYWAFCSSTYKEVSFLRPSPEFLLKFTENIQIDGAYLKWCLETNGTLGLPFQSSLLA